MCSSDLLRINQTLSSYIPRNLKRFSMKPNIGIVTFLVIQIVRNHIFKNLDVKSNGLEPAVISLNNLSQNLIYEQFSNTLIGVLLINTLNNYIFYSTSDDQLYHLRALLLTDLHRSMKMEDEELRMVVELFMLVRFHSGSLAKFCGFTEFHGGGGYWSPSIVRVCEIATRRLMLMFVMLMKDSG